MIHTIGVIADTHNKVRQEALEALQDSERIIHAGDICRQDVLDRLARIAPVQAVRGNNDGGQWAESLPWSLDLDIDGVHVHVRHIFKELQDAPPPPKTNVVITGHSHKPSLESRNGVLYLNPGSAGPRRFRLPISVAKLIIENRMARAELITLTV